ncbi:MAG: NUDIX domain-containing protein [Clostridia bacterium]|nr:NUDIX domain-containing protein [Clostridia bacterium]
MSDRIRYERSCGAVVYRMDEGEIKYLLVRSKNGLWGFPKGHMEQGETEHETALREILEETSLNVTIEDGFRATDTYPIGHGDAQDTIKQVVFFLAHYKDQEPAPQPSEITKLALMDLTSAMRALKFEGQKRILAKAHEFISK